MRGQSVGKLHNIAIAVIIIEIICCRKMALEKSTITGKMYILSQFRAPNLGASFDVLNIQNYVIRWPL